MLEDAIAIGSFRIAIKCLLKYCCIVVNNDQLIHRLHVVYILNSMFMPWIYYLIMYSQFFFFHAKQKKKITSKCIEILRASSRGIIHRVCSIRVGQIGQTAMLEIVIKV